MTQFADRVKDTTTTTGTGTVTLANSAPVGYRTFAAGFTVGDVIPYSIGIGAEWEVGTGTLATSTTLARTTVLSSSNAGALVNFSAGVKEVFCTLPASTVQGLATSIANAAPLAHVGAGGAAHANAIAAGAAGFMTGADKTKLDGVAAGAQVNPATTDALTEGSTNLYSTAARIRATVLTGLSTAAGTVVAATHTVLEALGFLQNQVSTNTTAIAGKAASGAITASGLTQATAKLLGRGTAATGSIEEITLGTNLSFTGTTLNAAGGGGTPAGSATELQYRNGSAFGAMSGTAWDETNRSLALAGATVTTSQPVLNLSQTWNASGITFTGFKFNVADTASAAPSLLVDLQVGGTSAFSVSKTGLTTIKNGSYSAVLTVASGGFSLVQSSNVPVVLGASGGPSYLSLCAGTTGLFFEVSSVNVLWSGPSGELQLKNSGVFGWSSTAGPNGTKDLALYRDAANTLAQRNSTAAQTSNIYGTHTDASNYRRVALAMTTAGVATLKPEGAGTGASGNVLHISGLPTANPGPGILWNNSGAVAIGT